MGLDMYLSKKIYVGANYEHRNVEGTVDITINGDSLPVNFDRISFIEESVAYWRKANAIHTWFVDNCQDGIDECQETEVSSEKLKELLGLAKEVKANPELARELLPTQSGFFFGSTDYDDWYFNDIDLTIDQLEKVLAEPDTSYYVYQSSW